MPDLLRRGNSLKEVAMRPDQTLVKMAWDQTEPPTPLRVFIVRERLWIYDVNLQ